MEGVAMLNWRNVAFCLITLGCVQFVALSWSGHLNRPTPKVVSDPFPIMKDAGPQDIDLSYRKYDEQGHRELNSRAGW
jgi:hypothetical protein